jgi:hypothetical protein
MRICKVVPAHLIAASILFACSKAPEPTTEKDSAKSFYSSMKILDKDAKLASLAPSESPDARPSPADASDYFEAQVAREIPEGLRMLVNRFLRDLLAQNLDALRQHFDQRHWQAQSSMGMEMPQYVFENIFENRDGTPPPYDLFREKDMQSRLSKMSKPRVTHVETETTDEGVFYWISGKMLYRGETEFNFGVRVFRYKKADPADPLNYIISPSAVG